MRENKEQTTIKERDHTLKISLVMTPSQSEGLDGYEQPGGLPGYINS